MESREARRTGLHPLHPTIGPFAGNNLGRQPSVGAPRGAPKGEAQGISEKLAAFTGAGGRPIGRANANALTAEGNAGRGLVAQPVGEGSDLGGGVEALEQFGCGLGRERTSGAAS